MQRDWPDDQWLEDLATAGLDEALISSVVKYAELDAMSSYWTDSLKKRERPWGLSTKASISMMDEIFEERARQLAGMTEAMNRFAEAVYS